ncbi:hypothetical protein ACNAW0_06995 [Micromonospora sp. SL1-18]|uniref:hypothetical protein n=1 Tax=Micromonospora sp. SL1-18 TaxID=3399128 RepID=UPI003A4DEEB8
MLRFQHLGKLREEIQLRLPGDRLGDVLAELAAPRQLWCQMDASVGTALVGCRKRAAPSGVGVVTATGSTVMRFCGSPLVLLPVPGDGLPDLGEGDPAGS